MKKIVVIFATLFVTVLARPQQFRPYGPPAQNPSGGYPASGGNHQGEASSISPQGPQSDGSKVYKYVTIHVAPTEAPDTTPRKVILPKKQDTVYQIIFIKAPTPTSQPPQEIELPAEPQRKTVVYVLVKKPEAGESPIRVKQAPRPPPSKPEVFFIRYKDTLADEQPSDNIENDVDEGGYAGPSEQQPSTPQESYGPAPSDPQPPQSQYGPPPSNPQRPQYGPPPSNPQSQYGAPSQQRPVSKPQGSYGAPQQNLFKRY